MTRLENIERRWISIKNYINLYSQGDTANHEWLIARVKRLEAALSIIAYGDALHASRKPESQFEAMEILACKALKEDETKGESK